MLEVKRDVRERMAAAMALVDAVILLAEEAVLETLQAVVLKCIEKTRLAY